MRRLFSSYRANTALGAKDFGDRKNLYSLEYSSVCGIAHLLFEYGQELHLLYETAQFGGVMGASPYWVYVILLNA